jgi:hypothetical protein
MNIKSFIYISTILFSVVIILGSITIIVESVPRANAIRDLKIGALLRANYPDQQALVNMFKKYLNSGDYIFQAAGNLENAKLLPGQKVGAWDNLALIEKNAPTLKSKGITILGYDLEQAKS